MLFRSPKEQNIDFREKRVIFFESEQQRFEFSKALHQSASGFEFVHLLGDKSAETLKLSEVNSDDFSIDSMSGLVNHIVTQPRESIVIGTALIDELYNLDDTFNLLNLNNIFALLRFGELKIDPMRLTDTFLNPYRNSYDTSLLENDDDDNERFYPLLKDPQTWNRTMITFALGYDITSYAELKFEYYILDEETGDKSVKDNQMLVQLKFNF